MQIDLFWGYVTSLYLSTTPGGRRKSSGGDLRDRLIGIAPPRLLCGRAASYGSIIIPWVPSSPDRLQPDLCLLMDRSPGIRVVALSRTWLLPTGRYLMKCVFSCSRGSKKLLSLYTSFLGVFSAPYFES